MNLYPVFTAYRQRERIIAHHSQGGCMEDKSTTTTQGTKIGQAATNNVGPFNENELLDVTKKAVTSIGLDFNTLDGTQKEAFIQQTIGALTGIKLNPIADLPAGDRTGVNTTPAIEIQFRRAALGYFRNSSKWDEDEFIAGYVHHGLTGNGTVRTEELHESRR